MSEKIVQPKTILLTRKNIKGIPGIIANIRIEKNVKQTKVAQSMGVLQSHVSTMENTTKKKIPQIDTLIKYLSAVKCQLAIIVK